MEATCWGQVLRGDSLMAAAALHTSALLLRMGSVAVVAGVGSGRTFCFGALLWISMAAEVTTKIAETLAL